MAVAAARILGRGRVSFVGALGDDDLQAPLREGLRSEGVVIDGLLTLPGRRSGRAFIHVDAHGYKTIHTLLGANEGLRPAHLKLRGVSRALRASSAVVIMDVPFPVALAAARFAKARGHRSFYSPGVRTLEGGRALGELLDLVDVLVLDRAELSRLRPGEQPPIAAQSIQSEHGSLALVATLGREGCLVARGESVVSVPAFDLESLGLTPVNTTGSGDAFLAAYACYSMSGVDPAQAAVWGNLAGALKASKPETRGSPSRRDLETRMLTLGPVKGRRQGAPSRTGGSRYRRRS